jgi:uncharacterized protein DUF4386
VSIGEPLSGSARLVGVLTVLTPLAMGASFGLLSARFDYPAVMNRPATDVLRSVYNAGVEVEIYWLGVVLAACALLLVSVALPALVAAGRHREVSAMVAAAGAVAALMTVLDTSQWVWLYPNMADHWAAAGPALRIPIEQDWQNYHRLLGEGVGRYLATLFSGIWALGLGTIMLKDPRWPRVLGAAGVAAGVLFLASALPALSFSAWGALNTAGFVIWFAWLVASGLLLLGVRVPVRDRASSPLMGSGGGRSG